jgi:hypothetical protein
MGSGILCAFVALGGVLTDKQVAEVIAQLFHGLDYSVDAVTLALAAVMQAAGEIEGLRDHRDRIMTALECWTDRQRDATN